MSFADKLLRRLKGILMPAPKAKRYVQLLEAVRATHARRILEVGTYRAIRSKQMIAEAKKSHPASEIEFFGFDLFDHLSTEQFTAEVSKHSPSLAWVERELAGTGAKISLYPGDTNETLPAMVSTVGSIDIAFIDGGHSLKTIENDWNAVARMLKPGSVVIFDDYWPDRTDAGAKPIVDAIDRTKYDVSILPITDVFHKPGGEVLTIQFARVVCL